MLAAAKVSIGDSLAETLELEEEPEKLAKEIAVARILVHVN